MPNHVTHRVRVTGPVKDLKRFRKDLIIPQKGRGVNEDDEELFDFNLVIPMPKELKGSSSGGTEEMSYDVWYGKWRPYLTYPWVKEAGIETREDLQKLFVKRYPGAKKHADQLKANLDKYGAKDWYDWSVENWGTKWNSYSFRWGGKDRPDPRRWSPRQDPQTIEFFFETAWSPPEPIFKIVSERYPKLLFEISSFDDGWNFACKGEYEDGDSTYECLDATNELYEYV